MARYHTHCAVLPCCRAAVLPCGTASCFALLSAFCNGRYTGADINCLCRDIMLEPVRGIQKAQHFKKVCNKGAAVLRYPWAVMPPGVSFPKMMTPRQN